MMDSLTQESASIPSASMQRICAVNSTKSQSIDDKSCRSTGCPTSCFHTNPARLMGRVAPVRSPMPRNFPRNAKHWSWKPSERAALGRNLSRFRPLFFFLFGAAVSMGRCGAWSSAQKSVMLSLYGPPASIAPSPSNLTEYLIIPCSVYRVYVVVCM